MIAKTLHKRSIHKYNQSPPPAGCNLKFMWWGVMRKHPHHPRIKDAIMLNDVGWSLGSSGSVSNSHTCVGSWRLAFDAGLPQEFTNRRLAIAILEANGLLAHATMGVILDHSP